MYGDCYFEKFDMVCRISSIVTSEDLTKIERNFTRICASDEYI